MRHSREQLSLAPHQRSCSTIPVGDAQLANVVVQFRGQEHFVPCREPAVAPAPEADVDAGGEPRTHLCQPERVRPVGLIGHAAREGGFDDPAQRPIECIAHARRAVIAIIIVVVLAVLRGVIPANEVAERDLLSIRQIELLRQHRAVADAVFRQRSIQREASHRVEHAAPEEARNEVWL